MPLTEAGATALAAGISAAGSATTSGINYAATSRMNRRSFIYNKRMADLAFDQNVKFWNMQNAYNTPAMQAARLRAAGFNPNASFGNGVDVSSGNAGDAPQLNYAEWNPKTPVFGDAVSAGINAAGDAASIISAMNQNDLTRAQVVKTLTSAGVDSAQADYLVGKNTREAAKLAFEISELQSRAKAQEAQANKLDIDASEKQFIVDHQQEMYDLNVNLITNKISLTESQKKSIDAAISREDKLAKSTIALQEEQIRYTKDLEALTQSKTALTDEQKKQVTQIIENLKAVKKEIEQNTNLLSERTKLAKKDVQYYIYNHTQYGKSSYSSTFMGSTVSDSDEFYYHPYTDEESRDPHFRPERSKAH